ncbi:MAG: transposase, partial [Pseudomonadota bacterium]
PHQGRRNRRENLAGEARHGAPEGRGRPLDNGTFQGEAQRRRDHADRHRDPTFGYKSHISIDRRHGIIRRDLTTDAAAHDGARLRERLIDLSNTASDVWADTAYRSKAEEDFLDVARKVNRINRKKPRGKPMAKRRSGLMPTNRRCAQMSSIPSRARSGPWGW